MNTAIDHQPRERAVTCRRCFKRDTWAVNAICEHCTRREARSQ